MNVEQIFQNLSHNIKLSRCNRNIFFFIDYFLELKITEGRKVLKKIKLSTDDTLAIVLKLLKLVINYLSNNSLIINFFYVSDNLELGWLIKKGMLLLRGRVTLRCVANRP